MNREEILAGNKLIAEFMGASLRDDLTCRSYPIMQIPQWAFKIYNFDTLKVGGYDYATSWDWLMPVVQKIKCYIPPMDDEDLHEILSRQHQAIWEAFWEILPTVNIEIIWRHVVGFCKWRNETTNPSPARRPCGEVKN